MKIHEVPADTEAYVKRKNDDRWMIYFTKEDKTYLMEQFSDFEIPAGQRTRSIVIYIPNSKLEKNWTTKEIHRDEYAIVKDWDTGWEMLVAHRDVKKFVNIPPNDY